jgi:hypothetical protein
VASPVEHLKRGIGSFLRCSLQEYYSGGDTMNVIGRFSSDGADLDVLDAAYAHTIQILEKHGNIVSGPQATELHKVVGTFVFTIALPEQKRRSAFPLPCGAGKTTAVRGFIKAINELGRDYKIVVCAEKIEALCELKRDLIYEDGVPIDKISLLHSYEHDSDFNIESPKGGTASEPSDSDELDDLRQFVLLSHSKLHNGFNQIPHDLLIYDESLVLGQGSADVFKNLMGAIGKFTHTVEGAMDKASTRQQELSKWLKVVKPKLMKANDNDILPFPALPISIEEARKADRAMNGKDGFLRNFLGLVHENYEMRFLKEKEQGSSIVTIRQTIPDDMHNIAILDASYNIRKLMAFDDTISPVHHFTNIKDHSDVTIHLAKARAGRGSVMSGLNDGGDSKLFHEVAELTAQLLKKGRKVLLFTFKGNGPRVPKIRLRELITNYLDGTDPDMLSTGGKLHPLTWGYETALNRYSHCDAVVFAGLLTLPHSAVAASVFAHSRDIKRELSSEELSEVVQSEKVHSLYQALSRGSCRIMKNGKAVKMDAYVFSHDYLLLKEALKTAMPGVKFANYRTKHLKVKESKKDQCKLAFYNFLDGFKGDKISTKALYDLVPDIGKKTKIKALKELLDDLWDVWQHQGRSVVRVGS